MPAARVTADSVKAAVARRTNLLVGGKGDHFDLSKIPLGDIVDGVRTEMEHTDDIDKALEIASDHFSEKPDYYKRLAAAGLVDEARAGAGPTVLQRIQAARVSRDTSAASAPVEHRVTIEYAVHRVPHANIPAASEIVHRYNGSVYAIRKGTQAPYGIHNVPTGEIERTAGADAANEIVKVRVAHEKLDHAHSTLTAAVAPYGLSSTATDRPVAPRGSTIRALALPGGYPVLPDNSEWHAHPHARRGVHVSTFKAPSQEAAFAAVRAIHLRDLPVHRIIVTAAGKGEVGRLENGVISGSMVEAAGAFRDRGGRFRNLKHKGHVQWIPHINKAFREHAERLGAKVKTAGSGGGLALVFESPEKAKAAHRELSEAGHRIHPHDIPGVLLVSYIAGEQPVHRMNEAVHVDTLAAFGKAAMDEDFNLVVDDLVDAVESAQEMAEDGDCAVAVVANDDGTYGVMAFDATDDDDDIVLVVTPSGEAFDDGDQGMTEGVAKRHRLAARLSAGRIRGRPLGGARLRNAMRARRWRMRNRGKHLLNKRTTVYRNQSNLHPLSK